MSSHITRYKNNKKIAIVKLFLIIIALNRSRYLVNSQTQGPRIYSWVEFGARNTPNLIPRNSNLILYAISIRFVIITVSATVQISDFRFQNWPIFRAAEAPPGARGRDDQWLFTGICAWADTAFRPFRARRRAPLPEITPPARGI